MKLIDFHRILYTVYTSTDDYYEIMDGSVRKYSLATKKLKSDSVELNRQKAIDTQNGRKK